MNKFEFSYFGHLKFANKNIEDKLQDKLTIIYNKFKKYFKLKNIFNPV